MLATLFGDVTFGDQDQLREFIANHDQAHRDLQQTITTVLGLQPEFSPLGEPVEGEWFLNHWLMHKALSQALNVTTQPGLGSGEKAWQSEQGFYDWFLANDRDHAVYEKVVQSL